MGSQLISKKIIETKNWTKLQQGVADALAIVKKVRGV
jgi:2-keto-3-deoxy-6-phosphogluconate aldolase